LKHYASLGLSESLFKRLFFESNLYREKVTAIITADITRQQEQVWARHILVATKEDALAVHAQLLIGNDFATLAQAQSTDPGSKDKGGDLGWFGRGKMLAEFESASFALKVGEISQPVQTTYGWHIIQALGHEIRPLTDTEYNEAVSNKINTWLSQQRTSATIVVNPIWTSNTPDLPNLETAFQNLIASATAFVKTQSVLEPTATP
jgi:parvulin-like peptidyl-prolyl isomerase